MGAHLDRLGSNLARFCGGKSHAWLHVGAELVEDLMIIEKRNKYYASYKQVYIHSAKCTVPTYSPSRSALALLSGKRDGARTIVFISKSCLEAHCILPHSQEPQPLTYNLQQVFKNPPSTRTFKMTGTQNAPSSPTQSRSKKTPVVAGQ